MTNNKDYKINIKVSPTQANIIQEALDLYSRILVGQLGEIAWVLRKNNKVELNSKEMEMIDQYLEVIKRCFYPELDSGSHYGIFCDKTPETSKISWDLIQVIRNKMAWHDHPDGGTTVNFGEPLKSSKVEELCNVEIENNDLGKI